MKIELSYKILDDKEEVVTERKVGTSYDEDGPDNLKEFVAKKISEALRFNLQSDLGLNPQPKNPYFQNK